LPLQQLEPVDLALGLSVAPGQGQGSTDRGAILLQTGGERLDGADAASTSLGQPGIEVRQGRNRVFRLPGATAANQGGEPPRQGSDEGSLLVLLDPGVNQRGPGTQEYHAFTMRYGADQRRSSLLMHTERDRRRPARHLAEAQLLPGKTLDSFDLSVAPMVSKAHVLAICAGDSWIDKGANLIPIGGPGGGRTHLASAIGLALVENGWRALFTRTSDLVQRPQVASRELALEAAINRLDRFDLPILDDLACVSKDQAETSVLFELIKERHS